MSQVKPNRAFNDARASLHAWRASATFVFAKITSTWEKKETIVEVIRKMGHLIEVQQKQN